MFDWLGDIIKSNPVLVKYTLLVVDLLVRSVLVLISGLFAIYVIKFWMDFRKAPIRLKNLVSFLMMIIMTVGTSIISRYLMGFPIPIRLLEDSLVLMLSMLAFALTAKHLDIRIDHWLDKKLGEDKEEEKPTEQKPPDQK